MAYRKIDQRIWNDAKFRSLSDKGKLAWFLILTHPQTSAIGTMRASPEGLEADLEGFAQGMAEAYAQGMLKVSKRPPLIYVPNFLKYNPPQSVNCAKAWAHALLELPECSLQAQVVKEVKAFADGLTDAFAQGFRDALPHAIAIQEHEPELEHEPEIPPSGEKPAASRPRRKLSDSSAPTHQLLGFFAEEFERRTGEKYPKANWSKDGSLAKGLLEQYQLEKLKDLIVAMWESDDTFIRGAGKTLGLFNSQIPKLLSAAADREAERRAIAKGEAMAAAEAAQKEAWRVKA